MAARLVKETMDKKYNESWVVIIGEGFGFEVRSGTTPVEGLDCCDIGHSPAPAPSSTLREGSAGAKPGQLHDVRDGEHCCLSRTCRSASLRLSIRGSKNRTGVYRDRPLPPATPHQTVRLPRLLLNHRSRRAPPLTLPASAQVTHEVKHVLWMYQSCR